MDIAENGVGGLDPRIQEAHTAFRQLLSDTTRRLKEITDKLGTSCIEKARCYYEALEMAHQAQIQCQQQAQLFQRASEIHAAAKETVALAEARFMSHQHEWNFDQAWQDMLNHATMKVMDAENQKAECGREHHRRAMLFHDAEKKLLQLEEKHRRAIIKARPYFEVKTQCDQMLTTQKERVEYLQQTVKEVKRNYATSLRTLENISNQIHQQRRDYGTLKHVLLEIHKQGLFLKHIYIPDIVANGPREPGVGAELTGSGTCQKYENEFNSFNSRKISPIRYNQIENNDKPDKIKEFCLTKENAEHIDKRSVDGSESNFTQWELELQASVEKLNRLSVGNSLLVRKRDAQSFSDLPNAVDVGIANNFLSAEIWQNLNQFPRSTKDSETLEKNEFINGKSLHLQRSYSMINSTITLQDTSTVASMSNTSKSLNSSPVNRSTSNFENKSITEKVESANILKYVPNRICQFHFKTKKAQSSWNINDYSNNFDVDVTNGKQKRNKYNNMNDNLVSTNNVQTTNLSTMTDSFNIKFLPAKSNLSEHRPSDSENITFPSISQHFMSSQNDITRLQIQFNSNNILEKNTSCSANSSPIKLKNLLISSAKFSDSENVGRLDERPIPKQFAGKTKSVKELPLLSFFGSTSTLSTFKGRSCSMIDLDNKQNLKTLLDNSRLGNIQAISAERLANVRDKLVNNYPETKKTDDIKK
ncbi:uncharacterized protein LOC126854266 isoform X2 [Cataglyphis hispanica]|uniref:uncharacterized protein LOC126854266 isoform X2 n=1 Tax=Cataglyphis hispanica TaxID=1086592 RepID=UPI00217F526C|nr:uncharacterized protein LOC126854266 isoform X2 [Cataglyphis hispanica]